MLGADAAAGVRVGQPVPQARQTPRPALWGTGLLCDTAPAGYVVLVTPAFESDRLVPGAVTVGFWAEYCDSTGCGSLPTYQEMWLGPTP